MSYIATSRLRAWLLATLWLGAGTAPFSLKAQDATPGADPAQQLQALAAQEQAAVDSGDPTAISDAGRRLAAAALRALGNLAAQQDDFGRASDDFGQSAAVAPDVDPALSLLMITSNVRAGRPDQARQIAGQMVVAAGDTARIHIVVANAYRNADDLATTIVHLSKAVELDPQFAPAHLALGDAYWELNEYQYNAESLHQFQQAQQLAPDDYLNNLELGSLLSQYQRYAEAEPMLRKAAMQNPSSPDPWLQLGMNAYAQARLDQAQSALERAAALSNDDPAQNNYQVRRAYAVLSRIEAASGNQQKAAQWARLAAQTQQTMLRKGAGIALSESTGLFSSGPPRSQPMGTIRKAASSPSTRSPEQQELERHLQSIVAKSLNDAGTALARSHDYAGALPLFRQAAMADPGLVPVMRNLGLAAFHTGAYAEAASAFEHALQQDAGDTLAQNYLAKCRALLPPQRP